MLTVLCLYLVLQVSVDIAAFTLARKKKSS